MERITRCAAILAAAASLWACSPARRAAPGGYTGPYGPSTGRSAPGMRQAPRERSYSLPAATATRKPPEPPAPVAERALPEPAPPSSPAPAEAPAPITPPVVAPSTPTAAVPPPPSDSPCFNTQYRFTCALPSGYVITDEADGPGIVMTLNQRVTLLSEVPASATVKVNPLGKRTLEKYMEARVAQPLSGTEGATNVSTSTAAYGSHEGIEVGADRQYASGQFKSKAFGFAEGKNAFIVTLTAPAATFERVQPFLPAFVGSIAFNP